MNKAIFCFPFIDAKQLYKYCEDIRKYTYSDELSSGKSHTDAELFAHETARDTWNCWVGWLNGPLNFETYKFFNANFSEFIFPESAIFNSAKFYGRTNFYRSKFYKDAIFDKARFRGRVHFREACFSNSTSFEEVKFGGSAIFLKSTFESACFRRASFKDDTIFSEAIFKTTCDLIQNNKQPFVDFNEAVFQRDTLFLNTSFHIRTNFTDTRFHESVNFTQAKFFSEAYFQEASFLGFTQFRDTIFEDGAIFEAILAPRGFDLTKATFKILPDFVQAHFAEAPRLDGVNHGDLTKNWQIPQKSNDDKLQTYNDKLRTLTARFRALKRLALQNQDYELERLYFQGELSAMNKIYPRESWHGWMNWLYEKLSDFGRSFSRPFLLWLGLLLASATGYYSCSTAPSGHCVKIVDDSNIGTTNNKGHQTKQTNATQTTPNIDAYLASTGIAFTNGVGFLGIGNEEYAKQNYACLYGLNETLGGLHRQELIPKIPGFVAILSAFQRAFSFLLLFLMALAIRNHFRISS